MMLNDELTNMIISAVIGAISGGFVSLLLDIRKDRRNDKKDKIKIDFNAITGTYKDNWFGEIVISEKRGKLRFTSLRSPQLVGEVFFYKKGNFVVKWDNAYFHADAHLLFEYDINGKAVTIKMNPISELTDFSYDFQDLDFKRVP